MEPSIQVGFLVLIAVLAAVALAWERLRPEPSRPRFALLAVLAAASIAAWTNFGRLHGNGHFVHEWEHFHYQLGGKYFGELGYDGLYVASVAAQVESWPDLGVPPTTRDVRNNWTVRTTSLRDHAEEVKARFSPERWSSFVRDNDAYLRSMMESWEPTYLMDVRRDHGFNGTPAWVFVSRAAGSGLPVSRASLMLLSTIDPILLLVALLALHRTYGARTACLAAIVFGTGHAWAFFWMGGAFLRLDWFLAVVLATCAARTGRLATAGALIGYATLMRLFPAALMLGPVIVAAHAWRRDRSPRELVRLLAGFSAALALGLVLGFMTGRGPHAWAEFADKIGRHETVWLTNNVGLRNAVVYDREILAGEFEERPDATWGDRLDSAATRRRALIVGLGVSLTVLVALASWRARADEALVMGMAAIFWLSCPSGYYWLLLALTCVRPERWMPAVVIACGVACHALQGIAGLPQESAFGLLSVVLAVAFPAWLLPAAWRTLRDRAPSA